MFTPRGRQSPAQIIEVVDHADSSSRNVNWTFLEVAPWRDIRVEQKVEPRGTIAMRNSGYGELLNKRFGILNPPTFVTSVSRGAAITFSRLRLDAAPRTFDDIPPEDAYVFHVNFLKQASFTASSKARAAERYSPGEGYSTMVDYNDIPTVTMHSPLNTVRLYVPRLSIQDFVREQYGSNEVHLKLPQHVTYDPILHHLGACLSALLEHPEENKENNSLLVDYISL